MESMCVNRLVKLLVDNLFQKSITDLAPDILSKVKELGLFTRKGSDIYQLSNQDSNVAMKHPAKSLSEQAMPLLRRRQGHFFG